MKQPVRSIDASQITDVLAKVLPVTLPIDDYRQATDGLESAYPLHFYLMRAAGADATGIAMDQLRCLLKRHARLRVSAEYLSEDASLAAAGLDQAAMISVILAIEDDFGIKLPETVVMQTAFASLSTLRSTIDGLASIAA